MRRVPRVALGLLVLSLLPLAIPPPAAAQGLPLGEQEVVTVSLNVLTPPQEVPVLGAATYEVVLADLSVDRIPDNQGFLHQTFLDLRHADPLNSTGWSAFIGGTKQYTTQGGDTVRFTVTVVASPTVKTQLFSFIVGATMTTSGSGGPARDEQVVFAKLRPYTIATVDLPGGVSSVGPFEDVAIPVVIANAGQYPEAFLLHATAPEGWFVTVQPRVTLQPGEERTVFVQATSPATRVFVPQETAVISIFVQSERDPGLVFDRATIVVLEGTFFPEYWAPVLAVGLAAAVAAGARAREGAHRRSKEQGRPGPSRLTPAQQVLLADMKRRDPERYQALVQRQKLAFRTRERAFMAMRGRRDAVERALVERQLRKARDARAAEQAEQRQEELQARELERQKGLLLREKERRERALAVQQARDEARRRREEERRARLAAPDARRQERDRRRREAVLRAEVARKQRQLAAQERKRRVELEQRRRVLERRHKEAQRRAKRAAKRRGKGGDGEGPA